MDLAALAPADDAAGDAHARPLIFGHVGRQSQNVLNGLMAVETAAPRIEAQRLDGVELLGAAGLERILGVRTRLLPFVRTGKMCITGESWIVVSAPSVSIPGGFNRSDAERGLRGSRWLRTKGRLRGSDGKEMDCGRGVPCGRSTLVAVAKNAQDKHHDGHAQQNERAAPGLFGPNWFPIDRFLLRPARGRGFLGRLRSSSTAAAAGGSSLIVRVFAAAARCGEETGAGTAV